MWHFLTELGVVVGKYSLNMKKRLLMAFAPHTVIYFWNQEKKLYHMRKNMQKVSDCSFKMPLLFSNIPQELQLLIIQKAQDIDDFVSFYQSCLQANRLAKRVRTRFRTAVREVHIEKMDEEFSISVSRGGMKTYLSKEYLTSNPLRIVAQMASVTNLTSEMCLWLTSLVCSTNSSFVALETPNISCSVEQLNHLLAVGKVQEIECFRDISTEFVWDIENVQCLRMKSALSDNDMLSLTATSSTLCGTRTTSTGLNAFLKQWFDNTRNIEAIAIQSANRLNKKEILAGIRYSVRNRSSRFYTTNVIRKGPKERLECRFFRNSVIFSKLE